MAGSSLLPALRVVRWPGEAGPVLSCAGELSVATAEALQRELDLLVPLGHPAVLVDLTECHFLDLDGLFVLLECLQQISREGRHLVLVAGSGWIARWLRLTGIDQAFPVYPTQQAALEALRGVARPPAPATWEEAREATAAQWQSIREALEQVPAEELMRRLTAMTALCERSAKILRERSIPARWYCQSCPLFHALGGKPGDIGCRSVRDPVIAAVRAGDLATAKTFIDEVIRLVETMPLPGEGPSP